MAITGRAPLHFRCGQGVEVPCKCKKIRRWRNRSARFEFTSRQSDGSVT